MRSEHLKTEESRVKIWYQLYEFKTPPPPRLYVAFRSKAVVLLLLICCLLLLPLWESVIVLCLCYVTSCPFYFYFPLDGEERAGCSA